jgi:hypothetical protein
MKVLSITIDMHSQLRTCDGYNKAEGREGNLVKNSYDYLVRPTKNGCPVTVHIYHTPLRRQNRRYGLTSVEPSGEFGLQVYMHNV